MESRIGEWRTTGFKKWKVEIVWPSLPDLDILDFDFFDLVHLLWKLFLLGFVLLALLVTFAIIADAISVMWTGSHVDFDALFRFFGIEPRKDWGAPDRRVTERLWREGLEAMRRRTQERRRIQEMI